MKDYLQLACATANALAAAACSANTIIMNEWMNGSNSASDLASSRRQYCALYKFIYLLNLLTNIKHKIIHKLDAILTYYCFCF